MNIGVQAQLLVPPRTGTGQYTYHLLKNLFGVDEENFYDLLIFDSKTDPSRYFGEGQRNFDYTFVSSFPFRLYRLLYKMGFQTPVEWVHGAHDLHFSTTFYIFPPQKGKGVVTIHDLAYLDVPQFVTPSYIKWQGRETKRWVREAGGIVANSHYTKSRLIEEFDIGEDKISVAPPGVSSNYKPARGKEVEKAKEKYGIKNPFVLYLGTLDPRKNISALVSAFSRLEESEDLNLVIAGKKGWMFEKIADDARALKVEDRVIFTGYVSDEDKIPLLSGAEVFVYPSFYEGFGIPVVEAQACGTPVITSNVSALPEAAGEGALLVDPGSEDDLYEALKRVLGSSKVRQDLVKQGLKNSRKFTWESSAGDVLDLFKHLV